MDKVGCGRLKARETSFFKWKAIFLQGESMNASEGKKFPWIEWIHFSKYFKQFLELYTGSAGGASGIPKYLK